MSAVTARRTPASRPASPWAACAAPRQVKDRALKVVCGFTRHRRGGAVLDPRHAGLEGFQGISLDLFTKITPGPGTEGGASPTPSWVR